MAARALICGLAGPAVAPRERAFFRAAEPWGFILFVRNVEDPAQLAALTAALRETVGRDAPVLIDQEGGRVARLRPPHWLGWPAPEADAADPERLGLRYRLIAAELAAAGIDVNCVPMLDLPGPGAHAIVTDRVLGRDPAAIAERGRIVAGAMLAGGVLPVIKHLPGHGRTVEDSHEALPRVVASRAALEADLAPFRALADAPLGMTAHVVYEALDPERPATLSPACIGLIREAIGFDGALMTDDLSMGALAGPLARRARDALAAGCDLVLHCNGAMAEMEALAAEAPVLAGEPARRALAALAARRPPEPFDAAAALARYRARAAGAAA